MLARNDRFSKWRQSLDYSRHLCTVTRPSASLRGNSIQSLNTVGAAKPFGNTHCGSLNDGKKRKGQSTSSGNDKIDLKQTQASKLRGMRSAHDFSLSLRPHTGRKPSRMPSYEGGEDVYGEDEDDASSFCNSVSSIACSSILDVDKPEKWIKDVHKSVDKLTKFRAVQNWLKKFTQTVLRLGISMRTPLSDIVWIFSSISWRFPCSLEHYKFGFLLHAGDSFFKQKVEMQKRYSLFWFPLYHFKVFTVFYSY